MRRWRAHSEKREQFFGKNARGNKNLAAAAEEGFQKGAGLRLVVLLLTAIAHRRVVTIVSAFGPVMMIIIAGAHRRLFMAMAVIAFVVMMIVAIVPFAFALVVRLSFALIRRHRRASAGLVVLKNGAGDRGVMLAHGLLDLRAQAAHFRYERLGGAEPCLGLGARKACNGGRAHPPQGEPGRRQQQNQRNRQNIEPESLRKAALDIRSHIPECHELARPSIMNRRSFTPAVIDGPEIC